MSSLLSTILLVVCLLSPLCCVNGYNILYSGDQRGSKLDAGKSLTSGTYKLKMLDNCNLVLYDGTQIIWQTSTARDSNADGCYLTLLSNGNLVIYTQNLDVVWSSGSDQGYDYYYVMILQPDRNLVVYGGPIWADGTYTPFVVNVANNNATAAPGAKYP